MIVTRSDHVLLWSWLYLYVARATAWFMIGFWGAVLRGRRLVGWVISGTGINIAFDFAFVSGVFTSWLFPALTLCGIAAFIAALHVIGRRLSLQARSVDASLCRNCEYNLTGNLSGRCPEWGTPISVSWTT